MSVHYTWRAVDGGEFVLLRGTQSILAASAQAVAYDTGDVVDTRRAALVKMRPVPGGFQLVYAAENGLCLTEELTADEKGAYARCVLHRSNGTPVASNALTPLIAHARDDESLYLWRDLEARMLLVPYDNDMWMRYETAALRAGRRSYDVTVLLREDTREGLLIGALTFDVWKNAIACPGMDARILEARCGQGASDEGTHDYEMHGVKIGTEVASSIFFVCCGPDWRDLLEIYGDLLHKKYPIRTWGQGVPFGFNSYAGLARTLNEENFTESGVVVRTELMPRGFENHGTTFINLDGGWQRLDEQRMLAIKDALHAAGQKAGIYDAPFACFRPDLTGEIPGMPGHTFEEIVLRNKKGEVLPRIDRSVPYDVTHPVWREWTRRKARMFIDWGYDYLKIDFLSHGGMEGVHHDPAVQTGREALMAGYAYLASLYDSSVMGRPFFLSLSIAPLFPFGFGNARRFSCDAFGLSEDVEYVLNAQTYSWWTHGRLYEFNDPDHIVLMRSFCMLRDSTEGEARARYTSAVIAGSVMLLSEDYGREGARERTVRIAGNEKVNAVARNGVAFRPVDAAGTFACRAFTACVNGREMMALFAYGEKAEDVHVSLLRAGIISRRAVDLWSGKVVDAADDCVTWHFDGTDAALLMFE